MMFDGLTSRCERPPLTVGGRVRVVQRRRHLGDDERRQLIAQRQLPLAQVLLARPQRHALHHLHRQEIPSPDAAEVERRDDVRVLELRREPRLVDEHVDERHILRPVAADHLERDLLAEARRAPHRRPPHLRHAARPDRLQQLVLADALARRRHRRRRRYFSSLAFFSDAELMQ
jgi:hypothetical protein